MKFCGRCGTQVNDNAFYCMKCGNRIAPDTSSQLSNQEPNINNHHQATDRVLFGIMCIIFNALGIPCFMRGRVKIGIVRFLHNFFTFGVFLIINTIKGIKLGIRVLNMTDEEYEKIKDTLASGVISY